METAVQVHTSDTSPGSDCNVTSEIMVGLQLKLGFKVHNHSMKEKKKKKNKLRESVHVLVIDTNFSFQNCNFSIGYKQNLGQGRGVGIRLHGKRTSSTTRGFRVELPCLCYHALIMASCSCMGPFPSPCSDSSLELIQLGTGKMTQGCEGVERGVCSGLQERDTHHHTPTHILGFGMSPQIVTWAPALKLWELGSVGLQVLDSPHLQ